MASLLLFYEKQELGMQMEIPLVKRRLFLNYRRGILKK